MTDIKLIKFPVNVEKIVEQVFECLEHYQWDYHPDVVRRIVNDTLTNKADVISALSTDPDWDWDKLAIHKKSNYEQVVDASTFKYCLYWLDYNIECVASFSETVKDPDPLRSLGSICRSKDMFTSLMMRFDDLEKNFGRTVANEAVIFGNTRETATKRYNKLIDLYSEKYSASIGAFTEEAATKRRTFTSLREFLKLVIESDSFTTGDYKGKWNEVYVKTFNDYSNKLGCNTTAKVGQKFSKPVLALLTELGYDKVDGHKSDNYVVWGWNQFKAKLGDAVSPQTYTRHTLLSVHPVDFLRMSMGNSWQSCHTIDKLGIDDRRGDSYEGQYCGGTLSYMRDSVSFVYYTAKETLSDDTEFCFEDKYTREMFHIGTKDNPFFVQGRIYPQSNDTGSNGLYAQYRQNVEAILSKAWDIENQWKVEGSQDTTLINSKGNHYRDYYHYDTCKLVRYEGIDKGNLEPITIGSTPICIECGNEDEYIDSGTINCCTKIDSEYYECYSCGRDVDENNVRYVDGEPYCEECATYCEYCDTYHANGSMEWLSNYERDVCATELDYDYIYSEIEGNYLHRDDAVYCEDIQDYIYIDDAYYCEGNDCFYYDPYKAREDGYYWYEGEFWTIEELHDHGYTEEEIEEIVA